MQNKQRAFISHASEDKQFAWKLVHSLNAYQLSVWFDARELRPGDNLRENIENGVKTSDFFVILLSNNSIKSSWVQFELKEAKKQQKLLSKGPIIIPALIKRCKIPKATKDLLRADFTQNWANGFSELLRGICRDRLVVRLSINREYPLELETSDFRVWIEEYIFQNKPLLFVLDDHGLFEEISRKTFEPSDQGQVSADLRYSNLLLTNYCLILPFYLDTLRDMVYSDNYFVNTAIKSLQTLFKLVMYRFCTDGIMRAFNNGLNGTMLDLKSVNVAALHDDIKIIQFESQKYASVGRKEEAAMLDLHEPIDFDLVGSQRKGIRNVCPLLVSKHNLSPSIETYWQSFAHPTNEISMGVWLEICMPQIAAEHIINISESGKFIVKYLSTIGFRTDDYDRMGPH